jgi:outer membrane protein OmpA-like peptidoglycan-associated protein
MIQKFFRCGDPSQKCPLSVTKEIIKERTVDGNECSCPCANPNCVDFREPVGFIDGISGGRAPLVYTVAGLVAAVFIGILIFGGGNPSLEQLKKLQARLVPLESSVTGLAKKSSSRQSGKPVSLRVAALVREVGEVEKQADKALATGLASSIAQSLQAVDQQISLVKHMIETIDQPESGAGVNAAETKRLLVKLQQLENDSETALDSAHTDSPSSVDQFEDFIEEIKRSMAKARQIGSPPQTKTGSPESELLKKKLQATIDSLNAERDRLAKFSPPPDLPFEPSEADIRIAASGDLARDLVGPLTAAWSGTEIIEGPEGLVFLNSPSKGKVLVKPCSVEEGFSELAAGEVTVFFADRAPTESELNQFGAGFKESRSVAEVVALDALTLLVNPDVLLDTFRIGDAIPLRMAAGSDGSSIRRRAEMFGFNTSDALNVGGEQAALSDPSLLALGLYHQEGSNLRAKRLAVKSSAESLALKPSPFTIATEDYRFSYRIVAWSASKPPPEALSLVNFVTSNEGQTIVAERGFVDLQIIEKGGAVPPEILAALGSALGVDSVSSAMRLSTNFRFEVGESELDIKAQADLERLPRFVAERYPNHKVVILGFTDTDGGPEINIPLSKNRAEVVATELRRSKVDTRSGGLGSGFPVDTNDTAGGKEKNRRAEVWVAKP